MLGLYIIENGIVREATDFDDYAKHLKDMDNRRVERTVMGDIEVSTVFLAIDHNFSRHGKPILFETMIFGGPNDSYCRRYHTIGEAKIGHFETVDAVNRGEALE